MTEPWTHAQVNAGAPPSGGNFVQETAHDYARLADLLAREGDWVDVDYFSRKGIADDRIEKNWDGFHKPPVPTAPCVREPRNRLVEMALQ